MTAVLVVLDGVLRAASGATILDGADLYRALNVSHDIVLLSDGTREDAERWIKREKLPLPPYVLGGDVSRGEQLLTCREGLGLPVAMLITSSPAEAVLALQAGITGIVFAHPLFQRPEYRPDFVGRRKPWDELSGELQYQASLREDVGAEL